MIPQPIDLSMGIRMAMDIRIAMGIRDSMGVATPHLNGGCRCREEGISFADPEGGERQ